LYTEFWWGNLREKTLEKPKHRWEDNIKMNLNKSDRGVDWILQAQDRDRWQTVVKAIINRQFTSNSGSLLTR
jgi:hypothetical protein